MNFISFGQFLIHQIRIGLANFGLNLFATVTSVSGLQIEKFGSVEFPRLSRLRIVFVYMWRLNYD